MAEEKIYTYYLVGYCCEPSDITIISVRPTKNPLLSPALSIDRIEIVYQSGMDEKMTLISPKEKERFIAKLKEINPTIKLLDK